MFLLLWPSVQSMCRVLFSLGQGDLLNGFAATKSRLHMLLCFKMYISTEFLHSFEAGIS